MLQDDPNTDSVMLDSPISFNASFSACTLFSLSISWNQGKNEGNSKISFLTLIRVVVTIAVLLGVNLFVVPAWCMFGCVYTSCAVITKSMFQWSKNELDLVDLLHTACTHFGDLLILSHYILRKYQKLKIYETENCGSHQRSMEVKLK